MKLTTTRKWLGFSGLLLAAGTAWSSPVTTDYHSETVFGRTTQGVWRMNQQYQLGTQTWETYLNPGAPTYLRGISQDDFDILSGAYTAAAGWSYASSVNPLSDNSLVVTTYAAQGTAARVGAEFEVDYSPHAGDPTAATKNLHWIQVIHNNDNLQTGYPNPDNRVDNGASPGGRTPFYDDGGAADTTSFYDYPGRLDTNHSINWTAELYLVSDSVAGFNPGNIIIYGGVQWGWQTHPVPEASVTLVLLGFGFAMLLILQRVPFARLGRARQKA